MNHQSPSTTASMKSVSESIWYDGHYLIPMAEVSHIEKDRRIEFAGNASVIFKHSKWNDDNQAFEPSVYLQGEAALKFTSAYCEYRRELEFETIKELQP